MMRKSRRRPVIPLAVFALVTGAGLGLGLTQVANAQIGIATCGPTASGSSPNECTITRGSAAATTVDHPIAILAVVTLNSGDGATTPDQFAVITYSVTCYLGGVPTTTQSLSSNDYFRFGSAKGATVTDELARGYTDPDSCTVNEVTAQLEALSPGGTLPAGLTGSSDGSITMKLEWDPATSATSSSSAPASSSSGNVSVIRGYDGKCLDDKGNSSKNRAAVIIWSCNSSDSAQGFTYSGGELKHNGKCVNDQGSGGSGTHLILWTCNGASNEKWFHSGGDGEFLLNNQSHGLLCIDDPGNSKTNGTRVIVWKCKNGSNQHWT